MKRILIVSPHERDANSFWRCMGPMTYLQKHSEGKIQITLAQLTNGIGWSEVLQFDLIFMHRPCRTDDLTVMKIAHSCGVPVWVDYDDWLFHIPSWNPTHMVYGNSGIQNIMAQCLVSADIVSCSTAALYEKFKTVNPNVVLIKNAYRSDLYTYRSDEFPPRKKSVYWRGSNTHDGDLLSVKEGFKGLDGKVIFIGGVSWLLLSGMDPGTYDIMQSQDVILYYHYIYDLHAKVCVFPLVECFFNHCKSNIAYIESIHAGAICIAPKMPEWIREGVINYVPHDPQSFRQAINYALNMSDLDHSIAVGAGFNSMKNEYDISVINKVRMDIVDRIKKDHTRASPFDQISAMNALLVLKEGRNG